MKSLLPSYQKNVTYIPYRVSLKTVKVDAFFKPPDIQTFLVYKILHSSATYWVQFICLIGKGMTQYPTPTAAQNYYALDFVKNCRFQSISQHTSLCVLHNTYMLVPGALLLKSMSLFPSPQWGKHPKHNQWSIYHYQKHLKQTSKSYASLQDFIYVLEIHQLVNTGRYKSKWK